MHKSWLPIATLALTSLAPIAQAAPRQIVLVVADGINPATTDLFSNYVKKTFEQDEVTGLESLKAKSKTSIAAPAGLSAFNGLLATAANNGYKTGIVTTGDVTTVAPLFYGWPDSGDAAKQFVDAKFDFIAGGGRAHFVPQGTPGSLRKDNLDLAKNLQAAGGSAFFNVDALADEAKGKVLALQSDTDLSYALDRSEEDEASFDDLVAQALDTLGNEDAPFVLVVHDTLLAKSLAAHDTPAAAEQFHQLNGLVDSLIDRREQAPQDFAVAVLTTGGTTIPRFTTGAANEQKDAFFILSNLSLSFSKAAASLKGADAATLDEFATEKYAGWKLTADKRTALLAGTLNPETALRASYEPALKIEYAPATPQATVLSLGLPPADDLAQALKAAASHKPGKPTAVPAL
jgi:hypothetical protein